MSKEITCTFLKKILLFRFFESSFCETYIYYGTNGRFTCAFKMTKASFSVSIFFLLYPDEDCPRNCIRMGVL